MRSVHKSNTLTYGIYRLTSLTSTKQLHDTSRTVDQRVCRWQNHDRCLEWAPSDPSAAVEGVVIRGGGRNDTSASSRWMRSHTCLLVYPDVHVVLKPCFTLMVLSPSPAYFTSALYFNHGSKHASRSNDKQTCACVCE